MSFEFDLPTSVDASVSSLEHSSPIVAQVDNVLDLVSGDGREEAFEEVGEVEAATEEVKVIETFPPTVVEDDEDVEIDPFFNYVSDQVRPGSVGYPEYPITTTEWEAKWKAEDEHRSEVKEAEKEVIETTVLQAQAEEALKSAKAQAKAATKELRRLIQRGPDYAAFDPRKKEKEQREESQEITETEERGPSEPAASSSSSSNPSQGEGVAESYPNWREVAIEKLSLKPSVLEKLYSADIDTIGELVDFQGDISNRKAKWPKGIGEAKVTEIEDALTAWLSENRDKAILAEARGK